MNPGDADDLDPKAFILNWSRDPEFIVLSLKLGLWHALEQEGFRSVRLRCEFGEFGHGFWRFAVRLGSVPSCKLEAQRRILVACAIMGYSLKRHFVAAKIVGTRVKGGFILRGPKPLQITSSG